MICIHTHEYIPDRPPGQPADRFIHTHTYTYTNTYQPTDRPTNSLTHAHIHVYIHKRYQNRRPRWTATSRTCATSTCRAAGTACTPQRRVRGCCVVFLIFYAFILYKCVVFVVLWGSGGVCGWCRTSVYYVYVILVGMSADSYYAWPHMYAQATSCWRSVSGL